MGCDRQIEGRMPVTQTDQHNTDMTEILLALRLEEFDLATQMGTDLFLAATQILRSATALRSESNSLSGATTRSLHAAASILAPVQLGLFNYPVHYGCHPHPRQKEVLWL